MGSSIAQRLMSVGHQVCVWNRNPAKAKPLVDAGAKLAASPAELVDACEITVVMLLNDAATEAVYNAPNGILKAKLAGKLLIDMSTIRPETMKSNGAAALQLSDERHYDLILSDLRMPKMDGAALYWALQLRHGAAMPRMIYVTGQAHSLDYAGFLAASRVPVLPKPFSPDDLRQAVRQALASSS